MKLRVTITAVLVAATASSCGLYNEAMVGAYVVCGKIRGKKVFIPRRQRHLFPDRHPPPPYSSARSAASAT